MFLHENDTVLFQGDSITDCSRKRDSLADLGLGYAMMVATQFNACFPHLNVSFVNRGISGNRACDLVQRWQTDCIDLKPDLLSILIGINDTWRRYDRNLTTSTDEYEANFYKLMKLARNANPDLRILILEPFLLPIPEDRIQWREDLDPKIEAARRIARTFEARYIPLDGIFAAASTQRVPAFWAHDGVHPTPDGHALIANAWLKTVA